MLAVRCIPPAFSWRRCDLSGGGRVAINVVSSQSECPRLQVSWEIEKGRGPVGGAMAATGRFLYQLAPLFQAFDGFTLKCCSQFCVDCFNHPSLNNSGAHIFSSPWFPEEKSENSCLSLNSQLKQGDFMYSLFFCSTWDI